MKDGQLREYSYPRAEPFSLEVVTEQLRKFRLLFVMLQIFLYLLVSSHLHDQIDCLSKGVKRILREIQDLARDDKYKEMRALASTIVADIENASYLTQSETDTRTPMAPDIGEIAKAAVDAGASAISAINTVWT